MNKKHTVQPLSETTRQAIIIAAIVVVAVIILSIALALILKPSVKLPDDQTGGNNGSSSLTIRNGDFAYVSSDATAFPKTAQNWTRYGYKEKSNSGTHDFDSISSHEKAVMGIIDLDDWDTVAEDLSYEGLTGIQNPGTEGRENADDLTDSNVYMIATKEATTATILSDSFSVASGTSVKITVLLNTSQLADGSNAVVMLQKSTVSALDKYWYAYDFAIGKQDGWVEYTFHIFNRENSTQYLRINIGIGNVYNGEDKSPSEVPATGEGVLFIDDVLYETVTADEYRRVVDAEYLEEDDYVQPSATFQPYKILENEDITDDSVYLDLTAENNTTVNELDYDDYVNEAQYSPFTKKDDFQEDKHFSIYRVENDGNENEDGALSLRLTASQLNNIASSLIFKDHHHISFWIRVEQVNKIALANVHIQHRVNGEGEWEDIGDSYNWTSILTSQDIDTDNKAGWVKYDIYLKPSSVTTDISILFTFEREGVTDLYPNGVLYVTKPAYETISYKDYNNASSGNYVRKIDLIGTSATTTITNGSFSSLGNTAVQPSGWTPAFAGDNSIYRDGKGNDFESLNRLATAVLGSGVEQSSANAPTYEKVNGEIGQLDDEQKNILKIVNNDATSFGYFSSNISLSSKTAYVISVLAKAESGHSTGNPYIYLLNTDTDVDRSERVIASIEKKDAQSVANERLLGQIVSNEQLQKGNGWVRYYFIIVTGDESQTVRLALFNGSLDGETQVTGTIYYDQIQIKTLSTYSFVEPEEDEDAEEETTEPKYYDVEWNNNTYFSSNKDFVAAYGKDFGELLVKEGSEEGTTLLEEWGISVTQPSEDEWLEMRLIPDEDEEDETPSTGTTTEPSEVDLGLLFSVISSVALVAALLVVIVLKLFKSGKFSRKSA